MTATPDNIESVKRRIAKLLAIAEDINPEEVHRGRHGRKDYA